jgi:ABC-2 type transport system permease protein
VTVFARPTFPGEYRTAVSTMVREIAFAVAGYELPVTEPAEETVVLGPSMGPMPLRDTMRPLYAFMVLIMEAIAISVLISSEVQQGTMTALLATPAGITDVLASKGLLGTAIAFSESALVLLLIRGLGASPGIVLVALLLGAVLVTGIAMIAGSAGKDLVGTMMIGMLMLIPLAVPAFAVLIPGSVAVWVQALPSYGLVKTVTDTSMGGAGWTDALPWLGVLAAWCVASGAIGVAVLRRRVRVL